MASFEQCFMSDDAKVMYTPDASDNITPRQISESYGMRVDAGVHNPNAPKI